MTVDELLTSNYDRRAPIDLDKIFKDLNIKIVSAGATSKGDVKAYLVKTNELHAIITFGNRHRFELARYLYLFFFKDISLVDTAIYKFPRHLHKSDTIQDKANQFAANLLMPEKELRYQYEVIGNSVTKLADKFQVDKLIMRLRLNQLGLHSL